MRPPALIRATGLTALLASLGVAVPAQAATAVGNNLSQKSSASVPLCDGDDTTCTVVPATLAPEKLAPGGLTAVPGVVVRWRVKSSTAVPSSLALRVVRGNTGLARSAYVSLSTGAPPIFTYGTRISVAAGDRLGVDLIVRNGANPQIAATSALGLARWDRWEPGLNINEGRAPDDAHAALRAVAPGDHRARRRRRRLGRRNPGRVPGRGRPDRRLPASAASAAAAAATSAATATPPPPPRPAPGPERIAPGLPGCTGRRPAGADAANEPPRITALQFNATRMRFQISKPASVSLLVQRVLPGRRVGARCVKPSSRNRRARSCTRRVRALSGRTNVEAGLNTARLRTLPPGRYRVRLLSTGLSGRTSRSSVTTPAQLTRAADGDRTRSRDERAARCSRGSDDENVVVTPGDVTSIGDSATGGDGVATGGAAIAASLSADADVLNIAFVTGGGDVQFVQIAGRRPHARRRHGRQRRRGRQRRADGPERRRHQQRQRRGHADRHGRGGGQPRRGWAI